MIPILYEKDETEFLTNGIGRLSDVVSCTVTEERNGVYECEFEYPINGHRFEDIQEDRFISVIHDDTKTRQPFEIYGRSASIDGIVKFYAHHLSYQLGNVVLQPFSGTAISEVFGKFVDNSINTNPFTFWTDKSSAAEWSINVPTNQREILGGVQGSILDVFGGGEYEWDKYLVKLYQHRGQETDVSIRYGKNLADIQQEKDVSGTYSAVVPFWEGSDGTTVFLDDWVVYADDESITDFKPVPLDLSQEWQEAPTQAQLRSRAESYLSSNKPWLPDENIEVDFVQLWQTEEYKNVAPLQRVRLCDYVNVYHKDLGIDKVQIQVVKVVYNVLLERYDSMELGNARTNLSKAIRNSSDFSILKKLPTKTFLQEAIDHATGLLTGAYGGHVVFGTNADGQPNEIFIMDTDDQATAVQVLRINLNGIGFSSNGINGPYRSAWTLDGAFVADFITAGTMSANRIFGGTLKLGGGSNGNGVLEVYNASDALVGRMNNAGLYAIAGTIGGWTIGASSLYNGMTSLSDTSHNGVWIGTDGIALGKGKFKVTSAGALTATNATLNGSLTTIDSGYYSRILGNRYETGTYSSGTYTRKGRIYTTSSGHMMLSADDTMQLTGYNGLSFNRNGASGCLTIGSGGSTSNGTLITLNGDVRVSGSFRPPSGVNISSAYLPLNSDCSTVQHVKVVNGIIQSA